MMFGMFISVTGSYVTDVEIIFAVCQNSGSHGADTCYKQGDEEPGPCESGSTCVHRFDDTWPGTCCTGKWSNII